MSNTNIFYLCQESEMTKEICYTKFSSHEKHFLLFQVKCQETKPFDRLQRWDLVSIVITFGLLCGWEITRLPKMLKITVETIDSYLLKILNTTRNINIRMKTIVLHVITNSAAWN
jgi:uncharacterized protein YkuJ